MYVYPGRESPCAPLPVHSPQPAISHPRLATTSTPYPYPSCTRQQPFHTFHRIPTDLTATLRCRCASFSSSKMHPGEPLGMPSWSSCFQCLASPCSARLPLPPPLASQALRWRVKFAADQFSLSTCTSSGQVTVCSFSFFFVSLICFSTLEGKSFAEMVQRARLLPEETWMKQLIDNDKSSWAFRIDPFQRSFSPAEKSKLVSDLSFLGLKGPVKVHFICNLNCFMAYFNVHVLMRLAVVRPRCGDMCAVRFFCQPHF